MEQSPLRLVKHCAEYISIRDIDQIPAGLRGIYVLYKYRRRTDRFEVVYIGMAYGGRHGMHARLRSHQRNKEGLWSHCSIFEVWDNIRDEEIVELGGLFRHISGLLLI